MKDRSEDVKIDPKIKASNLTKLSRLLFELSQPWRLKVLLLIAEKKQRHIYIYQKLKISPQETSRHLARLQDAKLIEKDVQRFYILTTYGEAVLSLLPCFEFLAEIGEDLMRLNLDVPKEFLERIGELKSFERLNGVMAIFRSVELALDDAKEYMWILSPEILMSTLPIIGKNMEKGLKFRVILPKDVRYPAGFKSEQSEYMRFLDEIKISIVMTEKSAGFSLPAKDGKIDFSIAFGSQDEEFHWWCKDLFLYYWENAIPMKGF